MLIGYTSPTNSGIARIFVRIFVWQTKVEAAMCRGMTSWGSEGTESLLVYYNKIIAEMHGKGSGER